MNWLLGFTMGLLSCLVYHRVEEPVHQSAEVADVIQAYTQGSKDLLAAEPDRRSSLESACIQIWGMKQND
jgi:hypothetical protein